MNKPKVLIVDDEELVLKAIERAVRALDYEFIWMVLAEDAIEAIKNENFDVIVADYHMPIKNGIDVLLAAKNRQPDAVRVLITGDGDLDIVINAVNEGNIFKYIAKPWRKEQLIDVITEAVRHKQLIDEDHAIVASVLQEKTEWLEITKRLEHRMVKVNAQGVQALMKVIQSKDMALYHHSLKVAYVADALAEAIKYSDTNRKYLKLAALFHDIGKIAIHDSILDKNGKLDDLERKQMNHHATVSAEILKELDFMKEVAEIVRQHHERYEGNGYPHGLSGDKILHASQVLSISDIYVALREKRAYKSEKPIFESLEIMRSESGKAFNPELFAMALVTLEELTIPDEDVLHVNIYKILE